MDAYVEAVRSHGGTARIAVLRDVLAAGGCARCALRHIGVRGAAYGNPIPDSRDFYNGLAPLMPSESGEDMAPLEAPEPGLRPCICCLGVLQVCEEGQQGAAGYPQLSGASIAARMKTEGHEFDEFAVELSLPANIIVRQFAAWHYVRERHPLIITGETPADDVVDMKECMKWCLFPALGRSASGRPEAVVNAADMRCAVSFTHEGTAADLSWLNLRVPKEKVSRKRRWAEMARRRNQDGGGGRGKGGGEGGGKGGEGEETQGPTGAHVLREVAALSAGDIRERFGVPPPPVAAPAEAAVKAFRLAVFVGGRYVKMGRDVSQSPWMVAADNEEGEERKGSGSVEEAIADRVVPLMRADGHKFVTAGREDIDVRMLGEGRPFVLEILNARAAMPPKEVFGRIIEEIYAADLGVEARLLQGVTKGQYLQMKEGEQDKVKSYISVVWLSRPITSGDAEKLGGLKDMVVQQRTPVRVLHRRSPLVRPRTIHGMKATLVPGSPHYMVLELRTQAGTYIKEFVHGDLGRSSPSLGQLLGGARGPPYISLHNRAAPRGYSYKLW